MSVMQHRNAVILFTVAKLLLRLTALVHKPALTAVMSHALLTCTAMRKHLVLVRTPHRITL